MTPGRPQCSCCAPSRGVTGCVAELPRGVTVFTLSPCRLRTYFPGDIGNEDDISEAIVQDYMRNTSDVLAAIEVRDAFRARASASGNPGAR